MTAHLLSVLSAGDYTSAMLRILGQLPADVRTAVGPLQREFLSLWHTLLDDAIAAGDVRDDLDRSAVVMVLTGALNWTVEWYTPGRDVTPEELARQFGILAFEGMATRRKPSRRRPR
jgi:hypothetical protein